MEAQAGASATWKRDYANRLLATIPFGSPAYWHRTFAGSAARAGGGARPGAAERAARAAAQEERRRAKAAAQGAQERRQAETDARRGRPGERLFGGPARHAGEHGQPVREDEVARGPVLDGRLRLEMDPRARPRPRASQNPKTPRK